MARYYNDFSIDLVCQDLQEIMWKNSTPNKIAGVISMALEEVSNS